MDNKTFRLIITDNDILKLLSGYKSDQREITATKALKIGLIALKNINNIENVDYVEKAFKQFKSEINTEFSSLQQQLSQTLKDNLAPETGTMSRVMDIYLGTGGKLADLFDEQKSTSAVSKIKTILSEYFDTDASKVVKLLDSRNPTSPLGLFRKDIIDHLVQMEKDIGIKEAVRIDAEKGTQKGFIFEELVFPEIEKIARIFSDTAIRKGLKVGLLPNCKKGDAVVTLNLSDTSDVTLSTVFEFKDKAISLNAFLKELEECKQNRGANVAVGVLSNENILTGNGEKPGVFREYSKDLMICVFDKVTLDAIALEVAYKLARAKLLLNLKTQSMTLESVDIKTLDLLTNNIKANLEKFAVIKGNLTKASATIGIAQSKIDDFKSILIESLNALSDKIRLITKK